jgi:hypothetical protein
MRQGPAGRIRKIAIMLRRGFHVLGSLTVGCVLAAACSAGKGGPDRSSNGSGSGASGGSGGSISLGGSAGTTMVGVGNNGSGGTGPDGGVPDETVYLCPNGTSEECCTQDAECAAATEYICTIDGECGKIGGTCSTQADCQNDTYCCDATCRGDGLDEPVCIPTHVGPGVPCVGEAPMPGVFSPSVQCDWTVQPGDPQPTSGFVLTTPLVADTPVDAGASAEIVIITFAGTEASTTAPGVLRILSGQDCSLLETVADSVNIVRASSTPALGNLDADADIEIVARRDGNGLIAFDWNGTNYEKMWEANGPVLADGAVGRGQAWDGPSIHDIDDDGQAEVILWDAVYAGATGSTLFAGTASGLYFPWNGYIPILGDVDADGKIELVKSTNTEGINYYEWNGSGWTAEFTHVDGQHFGKQGSHFAIADFGTTGASFDATALDGKAEIVATNAEGDAIGGNVWVYSQQLGQASDEDGVLFVATQVDRAICPDLDKTKNESGGPPTIGNLDGDPMPEFAVAGASRLRVFDFSCTGAGNGCEAQYVRWSTPSQDCSSRQTGASIFDFEGDGKAEVVYADECFLRVYAGDTGDVLYSSPRTSGTWLESPVIADVDKDQNTEIVVNNAYHVGCPTLGVNGTPYIDPLHPGVRCDDNDGCVPGGNCVDGFCRCTDNSDCDVGLSCAPSLSGGDDVCRATHPNDSASAVGGIRVLRERLDRWVSSRSIWNQHAYSISNVNEDGSIPKTSDWVKNWTVTEAGYNSFRQNEQGTAGAEDLPDITGRFTDEEPCVIGGSSSKVYLQATVCNRGKRAVGAALPATFYVGDPADGEILCTSYTDGPVPTEGCLLVYCEIGDGVEGKEVTMVVNDDGMGGRTTLECRPDNNLSSILVEKCDVEVPR